MQVIDFGGLRMLEQSYPPTEGAGARTHPRANSTGRASFRARTQA